MRVRIRRFDELRSATEPGDSELVEEAIGEGHVRESFGRAPPATYGHRDADCCLVGHATSAQLTVSSATSLPLLELDDPQPTPDPRVDPIHRLRRLRDTEVAAPSAQEACECLCRLLHAASVRAARQLAYAVLHLAQGLL